MSAHPWQFAPRFRRRAFGWRSDTPIQRIKEALTEIKQVARKEPVTTVEGSFRWKNFANFGTSGLLIWCLGITLRNTPAMLVLP